jgi:hypothetical protein
MISSGLDTIQLFMVQDYLDQERPLNSPDEEEETPEQKDFKETMDDITLSQDIDYLKEQWEKEK